jgi:hypothetical protein
MSPICTSDRVAELIELRLARRAPASSSAVRTGAAGTARI